VAVQQLILATFVVAMVQPASPLLIAKESRVEMPSMILAMFAAATVLPALKNPFAPTEPLTAPVTVMEATTWMTVMYAGEIVLLAAQTLLIAPECAAEVQPLIRATSAVATEPRVWPQTTATESRVEMPSMIPATSAVVMELHALKKPFALMAPSTALATAMEAIMWMIVTCAEAIVLLAAQTLWTVLALVEAALRQTLATCAAATVRHARKVLTALVEPLIAPDSVTAATHKTLVAFVVERDRAARPGTVTMAL